MLAREAEGYIYLVSSMGVTGVREKITTDLKEIVEKIREVSNQPVAVGFGIARPEQAAQMADISDGAIVGSAIVNLWQSTAKRPSDLFAIMSFPWWKRSGCEGHGRRKAPSFFWI